MNGKNCRVKGCFSRGAPSFVPRKKLFEYNLPSFYFSIPNSFNANSLNNLKTLKNAFSNNYPVYNKIESFSFNNNTPYSVVYLYQKDFINGTVRITKPGVYVLQEDITFNPNENDDFMPTQRQIDLGLYPKLRKAPFHLGFFAAITVESEGVIIDLNNKTLQQSKLHNIQQRFYANIEVASSPFIPNQGPSDFTGDEIHKSADKLLIMNGKLGLSSHHGIHGNNAENLILHNLVIEDFEVAGIALNGSRNVIINNVVVQNTFKPIKLISTYSQARFIKFRLDSIMNDDARFKNTTFNNKTSTSIIKNLKDELDKTFNEIKAKIPITSKLFANPEPNKGLDANVYGIVLSTKGVVINDFKKIRNDNEGNETIFLNNVTIKNISSNPKEIISLSNSDKKCETKEAYGFDMQTGPIGDLIQIRKIIDSNENYKGTVLSDAQLLIGKHNLLYGIKTKISQKFVEWSESNNPKIKLSDIINNPPNYYFSGGRDSMGHIMKGNISLFISAGKNILGENVNIEKPTLTTNLNTIKNTMNSTVYNLDFYKSICPENFSEKPYKTIALVNTTEDNSVIMKNSSNNIIPFTSIK